MHKRLLKMLLAFASAAAVMVSCIDKEAMDDRLNSIEDRIVALEEAVTAANDNAIALSALLKESTLIVGLSEFEGGYTLELSDGTTVNVTYGDKLPGVTPIVGIDSDGRWVMSIDNGETFSVIPGCATAFPAQAATPQIKIDAEGYWCYSIDGGKSWTRITDAEGKPISATDGKEVASVKTYFQEVVYNATEGIMTFTLIEGSTFSVPVVSTFFLTVKDFNGTIAAGQTINYEVEYGDVAETAVQAPEGWVVILSENQLSVTAPAAAADGTYTVNIFLVSSKGYLKTVALEFTVAPAEGGSDEEPESDQIACAEHLLDFSYAGYMRAETAPCDVYSIGYEIYDVTKYGAVPGDGKSDREAFLAALDAALGSNKTIDGNGWLTYPHKEQANAIIYFPAGEYILHDASDDTDGKSQSIVIRSGNFVIKGAGRDLTTLVMADPMQPKSASTLYSSPEMIQIKHNSGLSALTTVSGKAEKGAFSVNVASTAGISEGTWVCLYVKNSNSDFVAQEVAPYTADPSWDIFKTGVEVIDYHQVKSVSGNTVTFYEPLMHDVDSKYGWEVKKFPHYENVGIEDLTFKGNAVADFEHHKDWNHDGGYKPLSMNRLVNSWIRRVGFISTSEACSIVNSANVSAYDITMSGNRGHAAVRSQASSRVLIAATTDVCSNGAGNFHGVGVSKQSIGTVLYRNVWGDDSCFEAHATQPRATLIDCCKGGWHRGHMGGSANQAPHHLADLTIWNFEATQTSESGEFQWWDKSISWWRFLPPVIVGFRSANGLTFDPTQVIADELNGQVPPQESLFETQLEARLGYVPSWLISLKTINY